LTGSSLISASDLFSPQQSTIEKLRKLQHEFGDPDDVEEESSIVFSPNASLSGSRPNTGGF
jgi:hypothetical protein